MTTKIEREIVYDTIFSLLIDNEIDYIPTPLSKICSILNIQLVPLSKAIERGLTTSFMFDHWGNMDGALDVYVKEDKIYPKIVFNDGLKAERQRFTVAEEITHFLLGHHMDQRCNKNSDKFSEEYYKKCDELARIGAGLLICPPPFFYTLNIYNNANDIGRICLLSPKCSDVRYKIMSKYREEIISHELYYELAFNYYFFMDNIPCPICGNGGVVQNGGICNGCYDDLNGLIAANY